MFDVVVVVAHLPPSLVRGPRGEGAGVGVVVHDGRPGGVPGQLGPDDRADGEGALHEALLGDVERLLRDLAGVELVVRVEVASPDFRDFRGILDVGEEAPFLAFLVAAFDP